jgi:cbb3-type cytochrome oxidase maturation protein
MVGAFLIAGITIGFVIWGLKSRQFVDNAHLKRKALEEDEEDE